MWSLYLCLNDIVSFSHYEKSHWRYLNQNWNGNDSGTMLYAAFWCNEDVYMC